MVGSEKRLAIGLMHLLVAAAVPAKEKSAPIDRQVLVTRHNPVVRKPDCLLPLSVGNGEFAFTVDVTGLQTFEDYYSHGMPLATQAQWGWHSMPNPAGYSVERFPLTYYDSCGRRVGLLWDGVEGRAEEVRWLRANPHKLHLGRMGFVLRSSDGRDVYLEQLSGIKQKLDLWTGTIESRFEIEGKSVSVRTCCHPQLDLIALHVESDLVGSGRLEVELHFPYGVGHYDRTFQSWSKRTADWTRPDSHQTRLIAGNSGRFDFERTLNGDRYYVAVASDPSAEQVQPAKHRFVLSAPSGSRTFDLVAAFSPKPIPPRLPTVEQTLSASRQHWERFWTTGGAVELAESANPQARELERRIVLSQYLTAIQCAGSIPPQESGLTHNSWHGKYHLEMHWWHAAHFGLWGRIELLERSLPFYKNALLPKSRELAASQGYEGARWIKCAGPECRQMPGYVEPFLIWQQGHPIYYAELCYRAKPTRETLEAYQGIVFESAKFMASFACWDETGGRFVLGPPVAAASEYYLENIRDGRNQAYSLAYWDFGLAIAQQWRQRLGLAREPKWDHVRRHLSPLPVKGGLYVEFESVPESFTLRKGHQSFLAPLGVLPGGMVDTETMRRTLKKVMTTWDWDSTWGWDFPMIAMTAARLGEGKLAIEALLKQARGNRWLANGHCYQFADLPADLAANGGLLMAVAMMAAGWDGCPDRNAPGFPQDGSWTVRWEGLKPMP